MTYFPMLFQENPSQKFSYVYVTSEGVKWESSERIFIIVYQKSEGRGGCAATSHFYEFSRRARKVSGAEWGRIMKIVEKST
jgi:hypothetical protein